MDRYLKAQIEALNLPNDTDAEAFIDIQIVSNGNRTNWMRIDRATLDGVVKALDAGHKRREREDA